MAVNEKDFCNTVLGKAFHNICNNGFYRGRAERYCARETTEIFTAAKRNNRDVISTGFFRNTFGFPLLKIVRKELNENYEPIIFGEYYVNSDVWDYRVQYSAGEL